VPLFLFIFTLIEQTYNIYIYYSESAALVIFIAFARWRASSGVPSRDSNSGLPYVQQADALLSEPRRTQILSPLTGVKASYEVGLKSTQPVGTHAPIYILRHKVSSQPYVSPPSSYSPFSYWMFHFWIIGEPGFVVVRVDRWTYESTMRRWD
jgi:hypothetical protein